MKVKSESEVPQLCLTLSNPMDSSHSDWRIVVPHCGFDLHFSDNTTSVLLPGGALWATVHGVAKS